jgi:hypothetical protein
VYPLLSSSFAKYAPSCPETPKINAFFMFYLSDL